MPYPAALAAAKASIGSFICLLRVADPICTVPIYTVPIGMIEPAIMLEEALVNSNSLLSALI